MNQNLYGLLIEKYGKWGITKKERMLLLSQEGISYYPLPDNDNAFHERFLKLKTDIKNYDKNNIQELMQRAIINNEKDKFPKTKMKGEISWKNLDEKPDDGNIIFFDNTIDDKDELKKQNKEWKCVYVENEKKLITFLKKDLLNTKNKSEKDDTKNQKKADDNQNNKASTQNNQFTHYKFLQCLEDIYQILWGEYINVYSDSNKKPEPGKLIELELSIKIVLNEFIKYCERLVQVILSYLKKQSFEDRSVSKIIPIIFPSLLESKTSEHYLIYHFFGITITMTWNVITYSDEDNQRQLELENEKRGNVNANSQQINNNRKESKGVNSNGSNSGAGGRDSGNRDNVFNILYGTWDNLKANFKQIDFYQNSVREFLQDKSKVLRVPLTCLIDYCGFRFLCEYELPGKTKISDSQRFESKREISEKINPEFYQKCYNLFNELFFCNVLKKGGAFQKDEDNYGSNRSYLENNKNGPGMEKTPYEKLFDIANDYFTRHDNSGEINIEQKGNQNKKIFFKALLEEALKDNKSQRIIDYFNINYDEFNNLTVYHRPNSQDDTFFPKKIYYRAELPELISSSTGKDMSFGEQNFEYRNDKDNLENNKVNDEKNQSKLSTHLDRFLNIFNNSLNSFYFKIYDSETMDNLIHSHGLNLRSLGYIAEKSESPYIKEFAINEMIARTCKKLIFSALATEMMIPILYLIKKSPSPTKSDFKSSLLPYKYQKLYVKHENKSEQKEDTTSTTDWEYFKHLKEISLGVPSSGATIEFKFYYSSWDLKSTGQQKNNDEATRNEIVNISSSEDKKNQKITNDNDAHNQNKKATTIIPDAHIAMSKNIIAHFLNVLFNKTDQKIRIKDKFINHKELWELIREEITNYYKIESKEILIFCKLNCMSLPPFLSALEYHTGIRLNWGKVKADNENLEQNEQTIRNMKSKESEKKPELTVKNTTGNYNNKHILNIVWKPEDVLEILPKTKTFSYNFFKSNDKEKNEEYICNYSQYIINRNLNQVDNFDKFMLIRFFYEKINKTNNFSLWYVVFFNELKYESLENMKESKDIKTEKEEISRETDSKKNKKSKKNIISNKNNECIKLYEYIFNELQSDKYKTLYKNTIYDLTGLLYKKDGNNEEDEINTNKSFTYSPQMQKSFSKLGYIMLNLTKSIQLSEQTEIKNFENQENSNTNLDNMKTNNSLTGDNMNEYTPKKNSINDVITEKKQLDGDEIIIQKKIKTILRVSVPFEYETHAIELIANYYTKDHPYFCDIKELCGKELLTLWKETHANKSEIENIIQTYFKDAFETGLKCLSINNIYLANLSLDVGSFYAVRNDYLTAVKILNWAYVPFKINSQNFMKDYYMYLKRFIKYNIKLGDFKTALALGDELLKENHNIRNDKDMKITEYLNKNLHLERIIYNLALIALKEKDFEKGLRHCQTIFENKAQNSGSNNKDLLSNSNNQKRRKTEYINWQKGKENDYPGSDYINEDINGEYESYLDDEEYKIKLKLYMKMIIKSLTPENKKHYLQAILRFYDSPEEKESLKESKAKSKEARRKEKQRELKQIKDASQLNGNLNEYFKNKILLSLKMKSTAENNSEKTTQMKEKEQQNSDYELFKKLFKYFRDENVFYSFEKKNKNKKIQEEFEEKKNKEDEDENDKKSLDNMEKNIEDEEEENEE